MDERRGFYPEQQELDYFQAMNADILYKNFPLMNQARTFLMDKTGAMGEAFRELRASRYFTKTNVAIVCSHEVRE